MYVYIFMYIYLSIYIHTQKYCIFLSHEWYLFIRIFDDWFITWISNSILFIQTLKFLCGVKTFIYFFEILLILIITIFIVMFIFVSVRRNMKQCKLGVFWGHCVHNKIRRIRLLFYLCIFKVIERMWVVYFSWSQK